MPNTPHSLHAFGFLMAAFDLRGLFPGTRRNSASDPAPHWIDYLHQSDATRR